MPNTDKATLERLVSEVLTSSKYKDIHLQLIKTVGTQELQKRRNFKEALKATKNKLHQIGGAYFNGHSELTSAANFAVWLSELQQATAVGAQTELLREASKKMMANHASTKERLPIIEQFYSTLFADLAPIHSILDLACGLNPLALPWMNLADDVEYYAYDIYQQMMDFLNQYMQLIHVKGHAQTCDVIHECPTQTADVALLLKALPCLEQIDKQATSTILHSLNTRYIIVSYPVYSLGGKSKGMAAHYEAQFREFVGDQSKQSGQQWQVEKYSFETELAFVLKK